MKQSYGIVLRTFFPQRHVLRVFDRHHGKIDVSVVSGKALESIPHASLVSYTIHITSSRCIISDIKLLDIPFDLARTDIMFLHHVLELADFFIAYRCARTDIFDFLYVLYRGILKSSLQKKIYVARFFIEAGMYNEHDLIRDPRFISLLSMPIESMLIMKIDSGILEILNSFLFQCVYSHPQRDKMKTMSE